MGEDEPEPPDEDSLGDLHPTAGAPETRTEAESEYGPRGPPPSRRYRLVENLASVVLTVATMIAAAVAVLIAAGGDRVTGAISLGVMIGVVVLFMTYQEAWAAKIATLLVEDQREK